MSQSHKIKARLHHSPDEVFKEQFFLLEREDSACADLLNFYALLHVQEQTWNTEGKEKNKNRFGLLLWFWNLLVIAQSNLHMHRKWTDRELHAWNDYYNNIIGQRKVMHVLNVYYFCSLNICHFSLQYVSPLRQ